MADKPKILLPDKVKHRRGTLKSGRAYDAKLSMYSGGTQISRIQTLKPTRPKNRFVRPSVKVETEQTKISSPGKNPQIEVKGKGAHAKLKRLGLRK